MVLPANYTSIALKGVKAVMTVIMPIVGKGNVSRPTIGLLREIRTLHLN